MPSKLLTQNEVAERLRCSPNKVKLLRLSGQLRYIHGRPPTILETELEAYIERVQVQAARKSQLRNLKRDGWRETEASARARARKAWALRKLREAVSQKHKQGAK